MKYVTTVLWIMFLVYSVAAQKVDTLNFPDYHKQGVKSGNYQIQDIFGIPYKTINIIKGIRTEMILVDSMWTQLDTSIYLGNDSLLEREELPNESMLLDYYSKRNYIRSPRHCGYDSFVISFLIDTSGHLVHVRILENIRNACEDSLAWVIKYADGVMFHPLISNGRAYQAEYVCKWEEEIYCLCDLVNKDKTRSEE